MRRNSWLLTSSVLICMLTTVTVLPGAASDGLPSDGGGYFGTDYDFRGQTVTICWCDPNGLLPRFDEGGAAEGRLEEAEKLFNCKIEFNGVVYDDLGEWYLARLMSGESKNDVWMAANNIAFWPLASMNALYNLDTVVGDDYWDSLSLHARHTVETLRYGGKRYVFSAETYYPEDAIPVIWGMFVIYYNKDMVREAGLEDPYELYQADEWTWEKFEEIAKRLTADVDADGQIDVWGSTIIADWLAIPFVQANGSEFTSVDENGRVVCSMGGEELETALQQLYEWNLVDRIFSPDWNIEQVFTTGKAAMMLYPVWTYWTYVDQADFEFGIVPIPKGPHADKYMAPSHALNAVVLPANAENPEALMAVYEFLYRDTDEVLIDTIDSSLNQFTSREDLDVVLTLSREWEGEVVTLYCGELGYPDLITNVRGVLNDVILGVSTFSQSLGTREPVIQGILDNLFNH